MRKKKTAPQKRKHTRTSSPKQPGLIVKANNERQSARTESALDNHFHRTVVGLVAGLHPARRAAAMAPVDALRS